MFYSRYLIGNDNTAYKKYLRNPRYQYDNDIEQIENWIHGK